MRGKRNFLEHRQQEPTVSPFDPKRRDGTALFNERFILLIGDFMFADNRKGRYVCSMFAEFIIPAEPVTTTERRHTLRNIDHEVIGVAGFQRQW